MKRFLDTFYSSLNEFNNPMDVIKVDVEEIPLIKEVPTETEPVKFKGPHAHLSTDKLEDLIAWVDNASRASDIPNEARAKLLSYYAELVKELSERGVQENSVTESILPDTYRNDLNDLKALINEVSEVRAAFGFYLNQFDRILHMAKPAPDKYRLLKNNIAQAIKEATRLNIKVGTPTNDIPAE